MLNKGISTSLAGYLILTAGAAMAHDDHCDAGHQTNCVAPEIKDEHEDDAGFSVGKFLSMFISEADAASNVSITVKGAYRYIKSNGLPNHRTGRFPNRGNPNSIRAQSYSFRVPANPKLSGKARALVRQPFGVALNGVVFDPGTAEFWNNDPRSGWNYEAIGGGIPLGLDGNKAHVQPNGAYHYHGIPAALSGGSSPILIGYAADGFPIYGPLGYRDAGNPASGVKVLRSGFAVRSGTRPSGPGGRYDGRFTKDYVYVAGRGDLDTCNGRTGVTPEYPDGTYHYVLTDAFPFVPRCFKGTPDPSFNLHRGGPGAGARGQRPRPGRNATARSGAPRNANARGGRRRGGPA